MNYHIKENSFIARVAAWKLGTDHVAIVINNTIHLHSIAKEEFLKNTRWMRHELCHIEQFKKYGSVRFLIMYLIEWMRHGYYHNKYEKEARAAEIS